MCLVVVTILYVYQDLEIYADWSSNSNGKLSNFNDKFCLSLIHVWWIWFRPEDGRSMKSICLLQLCRLGVIVYDWLDITWLKNYYNFGFDHFQMAWRNSGITGLVDLILGNSGPFASGDWILPDLTIQGSINLNSGLQTFPNTFYFSYATRRTRKILGFTVPSSIWGIHPMLIIRVLQMCQWRFPAGTPPPYKGYRSVGLHIMQIILRHGCWILSLFGAHLIAILSTLLYRDEDWEHNDGALNTISMTHPRLPVEHPNFHVVDDSECHPLQPGIWSVLLTLNTYTWTRIIIAMLLIFTIPLNFSS